MMDTLIIISICMLLSFVYLSIIGILKDKNKELQVKLFLLNEKYEDIINKGK